MCGVQVAKMLGRTISPAIAVALNRWSTVWLNHKHVGFLKKFLVCAALVQVLMQPAFAQSGQRPFAIEDLLSREEIGDVVVSPDRDAIAFVLRRSLATAKIFYQPGLRGNDRGDIWLAPLGSAGEPVNLTHGDADGSGYWTPTWSPDGARLAMLYTQGGDNVRLSVWEKATRRLTKLEKYAISLPGLPGQPAFEWVDNTHIAAVILPDGRQPYLIAVGRQAVMAAPREWAKAGAGTEPTANAVESGVAPDLAKHPQEEVVIMDITGKAIPLQPSASILNMSVSQDGDYLAYLNEVSLEPPNPLVPVHLWYATRYGVATGRQGSDDRYQLVISRSTGKVVPITNAGTVFVFWRSFRWAPNGRAFSVIGRSRDSDVIQVFRGVVGGSFSPVSLPDGIDPREVVWIDERRFLLRADRASKKSGDIAKRADWFLISESGSARNVTEAFVSPPESLLASADHRSVIGLAGGDVWRLDVLAIAWTNLTEAFDPKLTKILSLKQTDIGVSPTAGSHIIVAAKDGGLDDLYDLNVSSGAATHVHQPSKDARLAVYSEDNGIAVFKANNRSGTSLIVVRGDRSWPVIVTNRFLRDVAEGEVRSIDYRSLDGKDLKGWIILPVNYESGRSYPLITWVYPGAVAEGEPSAMPASMRINEENSYYGLNLQLLSAHGYAVLVPSMPLDRADEPYMQLAKGVLPAVDKAIELGIADPHKLVLFGQSFGGFATYGLITQTTRFQAAIAMAGPSNLVSFYGTFDARIRYEQFAHEHLFSQAVLEGELGMGNPPWKDIGRYLRNSPLFYIERVQTPVLIIHGDLDAVSITQAEEFFSALYRQGKRARFVRYWGEGHTLSSPANVRDMWKEILVWCDQFIGPSTSAGNTAAHAMRQ